MRMLPPSAVMKGIEKKKRGSTESFFQRHITPSIKQRAAEKSRWSRWHKKLSKPQGPPDRRKKKATRTGYGHPQDGNEERKIEILLPITGRQRGNLKIKGNLLTDNNNSEHSRLWRLSDQTWVYNPPWQVDEPSLLSQWRYCEQSFSLYRHQKESRLLEVIIPNLRYLEWNNK